MKYLRNASAYRMPNEELLIGKEFLLVVRQLANNKETDEETTFPHLQKVHTFT